MKLELMKEFRFEASHVLPRHPGKCQRLHGHSWILRVYFEGPISNATGFVKDYSEIKSAIQPIIDDLDHRHLGQWWMYTEDQQAKWGVPGLPGNFYPSSENLIVYIADRITKLNLDTGFAGEKPTFGWSKLELDETCTSRCTLTRKEYAKTT